MLHDAFVISIGILSRDEESRNSEMELNPKAEAPMFWILSCFHSFLETSIATISLYRTSSESIEELFLSEDSSTSMLCG